MRPILMGGIVVKEEPKGLIFDIKRYAIHDGPGIRTTVFLKGCPARCLWCANPESQAFVPEVAFLKSECIGCGRCMEACPNGAVSMVEGHRFLDLSSCVSCGKCVEACPAGALELMGREVTIDGLYKEVSADRHFWERSDGGLTLSGGEPLAQGKFTLEFLRKCKGLHVNTAMETCLHAPHEVLGSIAPYVDTFICDMKVMDDEKHRHYTGVGNSLIKENLAWLLERPGEVLVRMPLIPGVNDDRKNLMEMAEFLSEHRLGAQLELLAYHRLGEGKYARLGRDCLMPEITPPANEKMGKARKFLRNCGLEIVQDPDS